MSTLASVIVADSFREDNLIPIGSVPTAAEQAEALRRLNALIFSTYGEEMGEPLSDWIVPSPQRTSPVAANWPQLPLGQSLLGYPYTQVPSSFAITPPKNSRIIFGGVTNTVYFPEVPDDGSRMAVVQGSGAGDSGVVGAVLTLNGNGRTIQGLTTKTFTFAALPTPTAPVNWLYRADLGDWTLVADMALTDPLPFPSELDDLWVCGLSIRMAPRFAKTVSDATSVTYQRMMKKLKAKYRQSAVTVYKAGDVPPSWQSYGGGWNWWN